MNNFRLIEGWDKGLPLQQALLYFASSNEKQVIIDDEPSILWDMANKIADANAIAQKNDISFTEAVNEIRMKSERETFHKNQVKERLFDRLKNGQLIAIGFEPPRRMSSDPIIIPVSYFGQNVDWKKNVIKYESLNFVDVRIVEGSYNSQQIDRKRLTNNKGRKSREELYFGPVAELCRSFNRVLCAKGETRWHHNIQQNSDRKRYA